MSWPVVKLGEIATFVRNGASIKQSSTASGLKITRIETIAERVVNLDKCGYADLSEDDYQEYRLKRDDILISHINSEKHLGKCAIFEEKRNDIVHGMNLLCFRANGKVIPKFLYHFFSSGVFWAQLPRITKKSVNQASFTVTNFKELEIPLPPLEEQKRIAAILDKADAIRQKRKQAIELADEFLRSVFLDMFGDPVTNPKGWKKRKLKSLLSSIDSGKSPKCDGQPANADEWGVLKLSAVTSGQYLAQENKAVLSKNDVDERFEVVAGDVLFTRKNTRELVAAVAYVFETEPRKLMPDLIFRLNIKDKCELEPLYLFSLLANKSQRSDIQQLAGGAAGSMPNISKAKLLEVEVPVPPIELQCRFAEVVIKIRKSHQRNTESQSNSFLFFNSLSQKAFSGQL